MLNPLVFFAHHLILDLLLSPHLLLNELALFFFTSLNLLALNDLLKRGVLDLLLCANDMKEVTLLSLFHFNGLHISPHFFFKVLPSGNHVALVLFFCSSVLSLTKFLFIFLLPLSLDSLLLNLHVTLPSNQDVICSFLCLIEFLPRFLFLLLKQCDSVREKLVIFLCALPRNLGGDEFAVQGLVIVVFIHIQVHLMGRWELRRMQLVVQMLIIIIFLLSVYLLLIW